MRLTKRLVQGTILHMTGHKCGPVISALMAVQSNSHAVVCLFLFLFEHLICRKIDLYAFVHAQTHVYVYCIACIRPIWEFSKPSTEGLMNL